MAFQKYIFFLITLIFASSVSGQKFLFSETLKAHENTIIPYAVPNTSENIAYLEKHDIVVKRVTDNWLFISTSSNFISKSAEENQISDFYFEYCPPALLDDSSRAMHNVNAVHNGDSPLVNPYTGKDVIVGVIDQGLDYRHPDFIKPNGENRVIRYWDHSITNPSQSPLPYNYGQIWYKDDINNGTITSNEENSGHGTTVTGICTGNGLANGLNKGMAPESDIIFVETNFNLPNWTLSIADACDFIFRVADSLGKPAVVNLSVGTYLGSHDGRDPAGEYIASLIDQKNGRLVVCAAGNSGNAAPYHAQGNLNDLDTNFIWFERNPNGSLGSNTVFFDLWSDISDAGFDYSFGANQAGPSYENRANTIYRGAMDNLGSAIFDTLRNSNGDRIATLQIYTETVGQNFHMQFFCSSLDSSNYRIQFSATGSGKYDLWSGEFLGFNKIVKMIPSPNFYPPINNYILPDSLQSIVSSWNCSESVISVANLRGRLGHINYFGNQYYPANDMTTPGKRAPSSSRGPSRAGVMKPDISASGDVTLASGPLWIINNAGTYGGLIDNGGYHVRNGGTSMASPTVAGIAALYLEKCNNVSWQNFKADLHQSATADGFTGSVPNFEYGYGKIDAFNLLLQTNSSLTILGDSVICQNPVQLSTNTLLQSYNWSTGENTANIFIDQASSVHVNGLTTRGCLLYSDTVNIAQGNPLPAPTISQIGQSLEASNSLNYQWYFNDNLIPGETNQSIFPVNNGFYSVAVTGSDGCKSFSNAFEWTLDLANEQLDGFRVFPNPSSKVINIESFVQPIKSITLVNSLGQVLIQRTVNNSKATLNVEGIAPGNYFIRIDRNHNSTVTKISVQ
jgi:subtilisin family serine protease